MQDDHDDERIRGVSMQAAHNSGRVPLVLGHVFDGRIGLRDTGIKKDVEVDAGCGNDPEEVPAQGAEPCERVAGTAEGQVEQGFRPGKQHAKNALDLRH